VDLRPDITSCQGCGFVSAGRCLMRGGVCSAITQQSESCRTHNHTLLSHLRLPPTCRATSLYIHQELGGPVSLCNNSGLWWRYSDPQPGSSGPCIYIVQEQDAPVQSKVATDGQSICLGVESTGL
jgi:hypothetical protein